MKKEDLIEYIDGIQPDLHMKTRLKAKVFGSKQKAANPKKVIRCITALCLAAVLAVGISGRMADKGSGEGNKLQSNEIFSDFSAAFIVVASAAEIEGETTVVTKTLEVDETYPYSVYFSTYDVSGLSESEKNSLLKKMNNELNTYADKEDFSFGRSSVVAADKIYMVICSLNEFRFVVQKDKTLKSINVKNSSPYGQMVYSSGKREFSSSLCGDNITVTGEDFDPATAGFYWDYTDELISALEENPDTPFSVFNDVITFTIEYTDGSKSVGVVEINFDTYGDAAAVCKKYENQKAGDK